MVEPEDRIEARIRNNAHVASVANETVNGVVHVLKTVVMLTTIVCISSIREGCIIRLVRNKLIGHDMKTISVQQDYHGHLHLSTYACALASNCLLDRSG